MARRLPDLIGQKFNLLTVIERAGFREGKKCRKSLWRCSCECGKEAIVAHVDLVAGNTKSCGCIVGKHKRTHGGTNTPTFRTWDSMRRRCRDRKSRNYPHYGGRGITVCDRWYDDFSSFLADMGWRPPGTTLDRKDNQGNYEPGNCRWATAVEQSNNRRSSRTLAIGSETKTLAEWERVAGLKPGMVHRRLKAGWTTEEVLKPARGSP